MGIQNLAQGKSEHLVDKEEPRVSGSHLAPNPITAQLGFSDVDVNADPGAGVVVNRLEAPRWPWRNSARRHCIA